MIEEADQVIKLQGDAYGKLKKDYSELDEALKQTKTDLYLAQNPKGLKDPYITGLAGVVVGLLVGLVVAK
jgi:hypothetical protein